MFKKIVFLLILISSYLYADIYKVIKSRDLKKIKNEIQTIKNINELNQNDLTPLMFALKNREIKIAKVLIENGADLNFKNKNGLTAMDYCEWITYQDYIELLKKGGKINKDNEYNMSNLMIAILHNDYKKVNYLLKKGADPNKKNLNDDRPLKLAIYMGNYSIIKLLVDSKAALFINDWEENFNALEDAIIFNRFKSFKLIIEKGISVESKLTDGLTPLMLAAKLNRVKMIKYLITKGASKNRKVSNKNAAHYAITTDSVDALKVLLKNNIDIKNHIEANNFYFHIARNNAYRSAKLINVSDVDINIDGLYNPLNHALIYNREKIVKILLEKGASPFNKNIDNKLILENFVDHKFNEYLIKIFDKHSIISDHELYSYLVASIHAKNLPLVKYLVKRGANINYKDNKEKLPIICAASANDLEIFRFLLKKGANINGFEKEIVFTILNHWSQNSQILHYLLKEKNLNINIKNSKGLTPLQYAVSKDNWKLVDFLIKNEASTNFRLDNGKTLLMKALELNHFKMAKTLIDKKNSFDETDYSGNNALFYVLQSDNTELFNLLINKGANPKIKNQNGLSAIDYLYEIKPSKIFADYILKHNDLNAKTKDEKNILILATLNNDIDKIKEILKTKIDINAIDSDKKSALRYAVENKNLDIVKLLISHGAKSYNIDYSNLYIAAKNNDSKMINYLIKMGARDKDAILPAIENNNIQLFKLLLPLLDKEYINDYSHKIQVALAKHNNLKVIDLLLHIGLNLDGKNNHWESYCMLSNAIFTKNSKLINYLLKNNVTSWDNRTSLIYAVILNKYDIAVDLLKHYNEDLYKMDNRRNTAFYYALMSKNKKIIKLFLNNKIDFSKKITDECNIIEFISFLNDEEIIKLFIPYFKNDNLTELLNYCINNSNEKFLKILLENNNQILVNEKLMKGIVLNAINTQNLDIIGLIYQYGKKNFVGINLNKIITKDNYIAYRFLFDDEKDWRNRNISKEFDLALNKKSYKIAKFIIKNYKTNKFRKKIKNILFDACKNNKYEIISLLINSGIKTSTRNSDGESPLIICAKNNSIDVAKLLILQNKSINHKDKKGFTALNYAAQYNNKYIVHMLLSSNKIKNPKIEIKKSIKIAKKYYGLNSLNILKIWENRIKISRGKR